MGKSELFFLHPDSDPDHSQSLMGYKLEQHPASAFFQEDPTCSVCIILLTNKGSNKQTDKLINNTSLAVLKMVRKILNRNDK